ncbi:MAG: hypothetical protein LCH95_06145 [Proteobacteria bacterium]|nr:hypothetical protein [Pseudomonadota bacterium]
MSIYEILATVALVAAGGFAFFLYRKDTKGVAEGKPPPVSTGRMFDRSPPGKNDQRPQP